MCFSPTASFTTGGILLVVGALAVSRAQKSVEVPLAMIPVLFAIQQIIEGALWLTFTDEAPLANTILTYAYSAFSHVLWPIYVPIAVLLVEPSVWRRKVLMGVVGGGGIVAAYLLYALITQPISAVVEGHHITYVSPHFYGVAVMSFYVVGTCVSALLSSHVMVRLFGIVALGSFVTAYVFYAVWFISVWCFFAAVMSGVILLHFFRRTNDPNDITKSAALRS